MPAMRGFVDKAGTSERVFVLGFLGGFSMDPMGIREHWAPVPCTAHARASHAHLAWVPSCLMFKGIVRWVPKERDSADRGNIG